MTAETPTPRPPHARRVVALLALAPWLAWALARSSGLSAGYVTASAMAFTPFVAALSPVPVLVALVLRRWILAAVALAVVAVFAFTMLPRGLGGSETAASPDDLKLTAMSLNLNDGQASYSMIVRLVRRYRVDVLSLQEVQGTTLAVLDRRGARGLLPVRASVARRRGRGTIVLATRRFGADPALRTEGTPLANGDRLPSLAAGGGRRPRIVVSAVHPVHPTSPARYREWRTALRDMPSAGARGEVRVLVGDFNGTVDQPEFRDLLDRGYRDVADVVGRGLDPTWRGDGSTSPLPLTIDHVLAPREVRARSFRVVAVPGTDHRAIIASLSIPAAGAE